MILFEPVNLLVRKMNRKPHNIEELFVGSIFINLPTALC
jgi:hypothetical protein